MFTRMHTKNTHAHTRDESCGQICLREKSLVPDCKTLSYRKANQFLIHTYKHTYIQTYIHTNIHTYIHT